jgi:hypothetical protein
MLSNMETRVEQLCKTVQHNCDISDARYARDYSMCVYLLRMQEHYRWKNAITLDAAIDKSALGGWVRDTEDYWDTIEQTEFQPLKIDGKPNDPFDADAINHALHDSPFAYSAGIGRLGQPHFVLAKREAYSELPFPQLELGQELARDSIITPAMTRDNKIIIRHDSIKRMLWQMITEWRLHPHEGPMARVLNHYGIEAVAADDKLFTATAGDLSALLVRHERGEISATQQLGGDYRDMLAQLQGTPAEGSIRAVGDLLADAISTWPWLVEQRLSHHLDFWLAGLQGIRETLLAPTAFYQVLTNSSHPLPLLEKYIAPEQRRWRHVADALIKAFHKTGPQFDYRTTIEQAAKTTPADE